MHAAGEENLLGPRTQGRRRERRLACVGPDRFARDRPGHGNVDARAEALIAAPEGGNTVRTSRERPVLARRRRRRLAFSRAEGTVSPSNGPATSDVRTGGPLPAGVASLAVSRTDPC